MNLVIFPGKVRSSRRKNYRHSKQLASLKSLIILNLKESINIIWLWWFNPSCQQRSTETLTHYSTVGWGEHWKSKSEICRLRQKLNRKSQICKHKQTKTMIFHFPRAERCSAIARKAGYAASRITVTWEDKHHERCMCPPSLSSSPSYICWTQCHMEWNILLVSQG